MDSLPIGSLDQSVELLRIETNVFTMYVQGKPFHPTVESLQLHRTDDGERLVEAQLHIASLSSRVDVERVWTFDPMTRQVEPWCAGGAAYPVFFETQDYTLVVEKKRPEERVTFYHENVHLRQAVKPLGANLLTGTLRFQNEVGLTDLELRCGGETLLRVQLEIFPSKMDYKQDYQMIVSDVNRHIYNLSFDFLRKTYHLTGLRQARQQSLTEYFAILRHVFGQLAQAVERIHHAPHSQHRREERVTEAARARKASKTAASFLGRRPQLLEVDPRLGFIPLHGRMYYPTHVREEKRRVDYDTNENRFVRWVLRRIAHKLDELMRRLAEKERFRDDLLAKRVNEMRSGLQRLLRLDFLQVGEVRQLSVSLVLQMAPGYREVYRYYLMLMKGLAIQSDLFHLSMKDLAQLYEYWCFLQIHDVLSRKYELVKQDIVRVNRTGVFVKLDKSQRAKMVYRNARNGEVFTLYYNALPEGELTPTVGQKPDHVLTLRKNDAAYEAKYIFDAKYRLNPAYAGTPYARVYGGPGPEEADINTMHRYRDAIVVAEEAAGRERGLGGAELVGRGAVTGPGASTGRGASAEAAAGVSAGLSAGTPTGALAGVSASVPAELERSMFGAYVLFPYRDEGRFREHKFYRSIALVNVGAFPLLPGATGLLEAFLDEIILDSPEKAYERSTRPRGTKEYYRNKYAGKNVLVGSLRDVSQLDDALRWGFYHVPLANISDHRLLTQLEFIALYQSKKQFEPRGESGVHWYGRIADWKVLRRGDIWERPARWGTEERLYVKFTVEQWLRRPEPIVPGGRGIYTLLYATKYMFDRAAELAELRLESEADVAKWREQRRRGPVAVELDHEQVDLAGAVTDIRGRE